ncbi:diguanylate cyclase [Thalassospira sp.]|uniref:GGDEF domain-containing response regulator n=1 Tax=Thalassospira sp. TaxID=1912094 RepID=UPI001B0A0C91|nr:diguanylate cyclase [Thalassospira sp.]MBO6808383.1 diguanylate cyclase [Thalassospira sp.]MBO6839919.1 diguanylate cyclase [Thalassospira sp.]
MLPELSENLGIHGLRRTNKVLIVDDDATTAAFLEAILEDMADTKIACSGEEALVKLHEEEFDVVLLDIEMPGMGGLSTCKAIKSSSDTSHVTVIVVTSHTGEDIELDALDLGATDFIVKPFAAKIVRARVRTHLLMQYQSRQLRLLSMLDGLTGVANRRCFDQRLEDECRRAKRSHTPLSLLIVDVDHFKKYNDEYGHLKGDECLKLIAGALESSIHRASDLVARIGGEEFAIILPETAADQLPVLAARVRTAISDLGLFHNKGIDHSVTISIGGASVDMSEQKIDGQELFHRADLMLYEAKAHGRNQVQID